MNDYTVLRQVNRDDELKGVSEHCHRLALATATKVWEIKK